MYKNNIIFVMMKKNEVVVGGKYVLQRKIGKGSFGQIYSGYNKDTHEEVAIKLVSS